VIDSNNFVGNVGDGTAAPNAEAAVGLEAQSAGKQSNISITDNVMNGNGKGVLAYNVTNLSISGNTITNSTDALSAAIRFEGNVINSQIQNNVIKDNRGAGIQMSARFVGPNSSILIRGNSLVHNAKGGLVIEPGGYTGTLDARSNYWGSYSGPGGDAGGNGDTIVGNGTTIFFTPWRSFPATGFSFFHAFDFLGSFF